MCPEGALKVHASDRIQARGARIARIAMASRVSSMFSGIPHLWMPIPPSRPGSVRLHAVPVPRGLCRSSSTRLAHGSAVVIALSGSLCESFSRTPRVASLQLLQTGLRRETQEQAAYPPLSSHFTVHLPSGTVEPFPWLQSLARAAMLSRPAVASGEDSICNVSCSAESMKHGHVDRRVYAAALPSFCLWMPIPPSRPRSVRLHGVPVPRGLCRSSRTRLAHGSAVVIALSGSLCESFSRTPRVASLQLLQTGLRRETQEQAAHPPLSSHFTVHLPSGTVEPFPWLQSLARAAMLSRPAVASGEDSICNVSCSAESMKHGHVDRRVYAAALPSFCLWMPIPPSRPRSVRLHGVPVPRGLCRSSRTRLAHGSVVVIALSGSLCESFSRTPRVASLQLLQTGLRRETQEQAAHPPLASHFTVHLPSGTVEPFPWPQSLARAAMLSRLPNVCVKFRVVTERSGSIFGMQCLSFKLTALLQLRTDSDDRLLGSTVGVALPRFQLRKA